MEHYEIAAYRSAHAFAMSLSDSEGAGVLQTTLDEERGMEQRMAQLSAVGGQLTAHRVTTHAH